jgi:hypothetical protein
MIAPPLAAAIVVIAGMTTPGYDSAQLTISRLGQPGFGSGPAVQVAICLVAAACVAAAVLTNRRITRTALLVAGAALLAAAFIRLDPTSVQATGGHRIATAIGIGSIVVAQLAYDRASVLLAGVELGILAVGLALLPTEFADWGTWERCLLILPVGWIMLSSAATIKERRAILNSSGS